MPEEQYKVTNYKKKLGAYDFNTIIILYHCDIVINHVIFLAFSQIHFSGHQNLYF